MPAGHTLKNIGFPNRLIVVQMLDGSLANALFAAVPVESLMHPLLSARQEQCLRLTAFRTDKEIAVHLGISETTVKKHVHEACQRLGVNRRKAALALMDPIVPDSVVAPLSRVDVGYPKHPIALPRLGDHPVPSEEQDNVGSDVQDRGTDSAVPPEESPESRQTRSGRRRPGYRVPPGNPVLRVGLVFVLMIVLAALVVTLVVMLGNMHEAVGKIDAAATAG